ncbi:hypothetical protein HYDPIDRAFT_117850 [Hydnomerulius pinastri MD-312]|uniref:G domain-containing protein n=1 Tax=Hydnomerulius pinastri MD-312 TaxID=994086 RepID=A0A0C9W9I3_9AGAM|nr:hypothetical protein HYDPIDRAFT_117850 [Hydnomerulius pinastri MD-312]
MGCSTSKEAPKVVVFGRVGSGASSVVNLIAGQAVAAVSPDSGRCTKRSKPHSVAFQDKTFTVYDFPGFDGPEDRPPEEFPPDTGLVIICTKDDGNHVRTTARYLQTWNQKHDATVPVIVVVNHRKFADGWWITNQSYFDSPSCNMVAHACLVLGGDSTNLLRNLIAQYCTSGS